MAKRFDKNYFKKLKEDSTKMYESIPALNWGETNGDGKYVISDRYVFKWRKEIGEDKSLTPIDVDIKDYIINFIKDAKKKLNKNVSVYVGTDSQNHLSFTRFISVIVLRVERNGGHVLVSKMDLPKIYDYRYRLLKEVDISGELLRNYKKFFKDNSITFELHSDFNSSTNHKSNGIVTEATNYLKSLGFNHKIKPEAFAASYCADFFC